MPTSANNAVKPGDWRAMSATSPIIKFISVTTFPRWARSNDSSASSSARPSPTFLIILVPNTPAARVGIQKMATSSIELIALMAASTLSSAELASAINFLCFCVPSFNLTVARLGKSVKSRHNKLPMTWRTIQAMKQSVGQFSRIALRFWNSGRLVTRLIISGARASNWLRTMGTSLPKIGWRIGSVKSANNRPPLGCTMNVSSSPSDFAIGNTVANPDIPNGDITLVIICWFPTLK
mmetsp:Transcript_22421/g.41802  ORF Transcript_22421/g.41802 Transcript_22421/m.41802 type:complete len:237 (+) Transcript_22421:683-1393(+)